MAAKYGKERLTPLLDVVGRCFRIGEFGGDVAFDQLPD
jgi:hypothetical protein